MDFDEPLFLRPDRTSGWEKGGGTAEHYWVDGVLVGSVAQDKSSGSWGVRMSMPRAEDSEDALLKFKTRKEAKQCVMAIFMAWVSMSGTGANNLPLNVILTAKIDLRKLGLLSSRTA